MSVYIVSMGMPSLSSGFIYQASVPDLLQGCLTFSEGICLMRWQTKWSSEYSFNSLHISIKEVKGCLHISLQNNFILFATLYPQLDFLARVCRPPGNPDV